MQIRKNKTLNIMKSHDRLSSKSRQFQNDSSTLEHVTWPQCEGWTGKEEKQAFLPFLSYCHPEQRKQCHNLGMKEQNTGKSLSS